MQGGHGILGRAVTRRTFIKTTAATGMVGAAAVALGAQCDPAMLRRIEQNKTAQPLHHRIWVWQFSTDGSPSSLAGELREHGLGVMVKTHDGIDWMSKYDHSTDAVDGPGRVRDLADYFEGRGVPFHAWSVIKGVDPIREAEMAAEVLAAGARSLTLDLEAGSGFWHGSASDAALFGEELRRLSPFGRVDISIDPRPWRINLVPMAEFVFLSDAIWPQLYWDTFNSIGNWDGYRNSGDPVPAAGTTPEFLLDVTMDLLSQYGRPVIPVGQGAAREYVTWPRFNLHAYNLGMNEVSAWRFGVTPRDVFEYFGDNPAGAPPEPVPTPTPDPSKTPSETPTVTKTVKATRTPTPSRTPNATRTPTPSRTPSPVGTATPLGETTTATATLEATATP